MRDNTGSYGGGIAGSAELRVDGDPGPPSAWITGAQIAANDGDNGGGVATDFDVTLDQCDVTDNQALGAGGVLVGSAASVDIAGGTVLRNRGTEWAGGLLIDGQVAVTGADLGVAADDNTPTDVDAGGTGYTGYGAAATFTCDDRSCTPTP